MQIQDLAGMFVQRSIRIVRMQQVLQQRKCSRREIHRRSNRRPIIPGGWPVCSCREESAAGVRSLDDGFVD